MNSISIENEIKLLKTEIPQIQGLEDYYLFSLVCLKYFYNEGYFSYETYKNCFADGRDDGGIDAITTSEIDDNQINLIIIQSKYITDLGNSQDIIDAITKMDQTIEDFKNGRSASYNDTLRRIYNEKNDEVVDKNPTIELVIFTSCNPSSNIQQKIDQKIKKIEKLANYTVTINYRNQILDIIESIKEPVRWVKEDKVKFGKQDGVLKYSDDGILINLSASSLKRLYEKYKDRGLFEQNFRYFIKQKKIDNSIIDTLKNKRQDFWFFNNGIIIGCSDFYPDGDTIKLLNFSIINGCQTTTIIGNYTGKNEAEDFFIPCKIVKSSYREQSDDFIADIAEASNSQKPISDRDLKSNRIEQRNLKKNLENYSTPIYLEIKRGEKKRKGLRYPWQQLKNELLGQLLLSIIFQQPGTARSSKSKIFSDGSVYNKIFKRKHDLDTLKDIIKLNYEYDQFKKKIIDEDTLSVNGTSIVSNGKFSILAILGFMIKVKRGIIDIKKYVKPETDDRKKIINKDDLHNGLFTDYNSTDFESSFRDLNFIILNSLETLYTSRFEDGLDKTVTNFFKLDSRYFDIILPHIIKNLLLMATEKPRVEKLLKIFN